MKKLPVKLTAVFLATLMLAGCQPSGSKEKDSKSENQNTHSQNSESIEKTKSYKTSSNLYAIEVPESIENVVNISTESYDDSDTVFTISSKKLQDRYNFLEKNVFDVLYMTTIDPTQGTDTSRMMRIGTFKKDGKEVGLYIQFNNNSVKKFQATDEYDVLMIQANIEALNVATKYIVPSDGVEFTKDDRTMEILNKDLEEYKKEASILNLTHYDKDVQELVKINKDGSAEVTDPTHTVKIKLSKEDRELISFDIMDSPGIAFAENAKLEKELRFFSKKNVDYQLKTDPFPEYLDGPLGNILIDFNIDRTGGVSLPGYYLIGTVKTKDGKVHHIDIQTASDLPVTDFDKDGNDKKYEVARKRLFEVILNNMTGANGEKIQFDPKSPNSISNISKMQ